MTTDNIEVQKTIRDYTDQLYVKKMDNLEEVDKFLEKCNFPKLNLLSHLGFYFYIYHYINSSLNLFKNFNWRLITLHYYSGFCHTLT